MTRYSFAVAAVLALAAGSAQAGAIDMNLSNDLAGIEYRQSQPNNLGFNASWLHRARTDKGDFPKTANLFGLGVNVSQQASQQLQVSVGGKAVYLRHDGEGNGAFGLGGSFRYGLPGNERVGLGGRLYFAPRVTSFGDLEGYLETGVRLDYLVLRQAAIYVGYRDIQVDVKDVKGSLKFDSQAHVGLELLF